MHDHTMTSKHHRWQTAWQLDGATASHASGLAVEFEPIEPASQPPPPGGSAHIIATAADGTTWRGTVRGGALALSDWWRTMPALRDPHSQAARLARVLREAAAVFTAARHPAGARPTLRRKP